jgi:manganese transport protein
MLGNAASVVFALALLFGGLSIEPHGGTWPGGSILRRSFSEPYNIKDSHPRRACSFHDSAAVIIFFVRSVFQALVFSQMLLSVQLPVTQFSPSFP